MKKIILFSIAFLICSPHLTFSQQTVSLSTFYPAPFGTYDRLRLVPRDPIVGVCRVGTLYTENVTNTLQYCMEIGGGPDAGGWGLMVGVWENDGSDNISLVGTDDPITFRVGINDSTPDAMLEVSGDGGADELLMLSSTDGTDGDLFTVESSGQVGIGTNAPAENLTIRGNGTVMQVMSNANTGGGNTTLRLTEDSGVAPFGFRGGFLKYDTNTNLLEIGTHNNDNRNAGQDIAAISITRATGDVAIPGDVTISGIANIGTIVTGAPEALNVDGIIRLRDDGANWGNLMVEYDSGNYYAVYAP